ncbi:MAG: UDP-N-acetylmuramate--L-alanine ligase [Bacteroidota bacterium]|nr:UDP-N-acetylmuramate--L-alanine ligase [Bacteroidota bacterium]
MNLESINRVHFIGIGGIGMSALAKFFLYKGVVVSGYDRSKTEITLALSNLGSHIIYNDEISLIKDIESVDLVVFTPAIPSNNVQLNHFLKTNVPVHKRAYVLGEITKSYKTIAVAGTHGKTTTSSIVAHLLQQNNCGGVSFLGGICTNYNSNILIQEGQNAVVEADEYDRSFLQLHPSAIILTSMDPDHLDIYGDEESLIEGFKLFVDSLKNQDCLYVQEDLKNQFPNALTYGFQTSSTLFVYDVRLKRGSYIFNVNYKGETYENFEFQLPGRHNLLNAAGAILSCLEWGLTFEKLKSTLSNFKGVKRRFEIHYNDGQRVYVDDYAHHPNEIKVLYEGLREFYPGYKLIAVFQPHLYSRTRDFLMEFQTALSEFDALFVMPIYPAREIPIEGINAETLLNGIEMDQKSLLIKEEDLHVALKLEEKFVVSTIGAGDIDRLIVPLKSFLSEIS